MEMETKEQNNFMDKLENLMTAIEIYRDVENKAIAKIQEILKEKGKTRYWLYIQLGLSYQNFKKILENETKAIKFENLKAICDILECTPNDLFVEYYNK